MKLLLFFANVYKCLIEIKRKMIEAETKSIDGEKVVPVVVESVENELSPQSIMLSIQCDYLEED